MFSALCAVKNLPARQYRQGGPTGLRANTAETGGNRATTPHGMFRARLCDAGTGEVGRAAGRPRFANDGNPL
jgi:hypothetical protein